MWIDGVNANKLSSSGQQKGQPRKCYLDFAKEKTNMIIIDIIKSPTFVISRKLGAKLRYYL